ncbi:MAG: SGNH/GDSL hydrolase family protein, partial [bacterium]
MKTKTALFSILIASCVCCCAANSSPPGTNSLALAQGDHWCAIGDSITHGGDWTRFICLYYATRFPEDRFEFFNCGIGGDTAPGAVSRFDWDIAPRKPTFATIMFGVNDSWWEYNKHFQPNDYIEAIKSLVEQLRKLNCRVLLITPPPYDATVQSAAPVDASRQFLPRYVRQLRELARREDIPLLDFYGPMSDMNVKMQAKEPAFSLLSKDRVHPVEAGHFVMAYLLLKQQQVPALVSETVLNAVRKKVLRIQNAEIKDLDLSPDHASFALLEKALPYPVQD